MKDYLVKAYAYDGTVRIYAASSTHLVETAIKIHDTWPVVTAAFGRLLTAGVIMGAMYKGDQSLTIRINGDGPINGLLVKTTTTGTIKGYVGNPHVHLESNNGKLAVGSAVGKNGFVHVTKDLHVNKIFTSSSELKSGEIAEDLTYYFATSEQIPSSVGLGVLINDDNSVLASGGYILQLMPGYTEETIELIENTINNIGSISKLVQSGVTPEELIQKLSNGNYELLEKMPISYSCDCNMERFIRGIRTIDKADLDSLINDEAEIEVTCEFCGKKYIIPKDELK